ncbi:hypothetical protein BDW66DRAFT_153131 [Aspergillus desertorum]
MASLASMVSRVYQAFSPPQPPAKRRDALKFGILGAANIAPLALITPAKSHPEVIIQAVSARNRKKAEEFAKAHSIPDIYPPTFAPDDFPNDGAKTFSTTPALTVFSSRSQTVLSSSRLFTVAFSPAWSYFRSLIDPANVQHVNAVSMIPWWGPSKDNINFNYNLSGGSMMAMGTYNMAALRMAFDAEPEECLNCEVHAYTDGVHDKCDYGFHATFRFPNGAIGEASSTLKGPTYWTPSHVTVSQKEVIITDETLPQSQVKVQQRQLTLHGFVHGIFWHRIDIKDVYQIRDRDTGKVIRTWEKKTYHKAYTFKEAGGEFADLPGEPFWMSYRHQLEQFVNRVKGRETQHWISSADSIAQMKMLDMAYEKSGLGRRPTSSFQVIKS